MPKVAIVGAGLIGRSWAIVFAQGGFDVALFDTTPGIADNACDLAANGLRELAGHGLVTDPQVATRRLHAAPSLADALAGAGFVHGRQRCLVAHPVNPPHLVPLVELLGAPWTAPETIATAKQIYQTVGQVPIVVRREIEGFILNRLQAALLSEAFRLAGEGFVSPQDLDETLKNGLGLRWSFMGPFETIELNAPGGIPDYCARYGASLSRLSAADPTIYAGDNLARILAEWGCNPTPQEIGEAMRRRDRRLAALKAHKREQQIE